MRIKLLHNYTGGVVLDFDIDRESPFQPGIPVSPDKFSGRQETIKKILRYVNNLIKNPKKPIDE